MNRDMVVGLASILSISTQQLLKQFLLVNTKCAAIRLTQPAIW